MGAHRTTAHVTADQIDMDIFRLAARIDALAEMTSRGKAMDRDLVAAAARVDSARSAVRKYMHPKDQVRTA